MSYQSTSSDNELGEILRTLWKRGRYSEAPTVTPDVKEAKSAINNLIIKKQISENQKYLDRINNYKPDPTAPSFGSASGGFETQGWKHTFEDRIQELNNKLREV